MLYSWAKLKVILNGLKFMISINKNTCTDLIKKTLENLSKSSLSKEVKMLHRSRDMCKWMLSNKYHSPYWNNIGPQQYIVTEHTKKDHIIHKLFLISFKLIYSLIILHSKSIFPPFLSSQLILPTPASHSLFLHFP